DESHRGHRPFIQRFEYGQHTELLVFDRDLMRQKREPVGSTSPVYSGYGSANTYQVIAAGGAYTFGATYSNIRFLNLGSSYASAFAGQSVTFNSVELNFRYQLTPALLIGAAYHYTKGGDIDGQTRATYQQGQVGVDYFLSKRTDVYLIGVYQH